MALVCILWSPIEAKTLEKWQQVPGTAVWMTVPNGWKAVGHRHKHALLLSGAGTSGTSLLAEKARTGKLKTFVQSLKNELALKSKNTVWKAKKDGGWLLKHSTDPTGIVLHAVRVKKWNVVIWSTTGLGSLSAVSAMHAGVLSGLKVGWKRPKPATVAIPGTDWIVKHPDGDWILQSVDGSTIHWGNAEETGNIQVGHFALADKGLDQTLETVIRGMTAGEGVWTWTESEAWRAPVRKRKGIFRRGESTLRRNRQDVIYRLDVFGFLDGQTAVMVIATSYGNANEAVSRTARKLSKTFSKSR